MLESDWLMNVLKCAIVFREAQVVPGSSLNRITISLRKMISVISKVLQQKNNQNPQRHWPNK